MAKIQKYDRSVEKEALTHCWWETELQLEGNWTIVNKLHVFLLFSLAVPPTQECPLKIQLHEPTHAQGQSCAVICERKTALQEGPVNALAAPSQPWRRGL